MLNYGAILLLVVLLFIVVVIIIMFWEEAKELDHTFNNKFTVYKKKIISNLLGEENTPYLVT